MDLIWPRLEEPIVGNRKVGSRAGVGVPGGFDVDQVF